MIKFKKKDTKETADYFKKLENIIQLSKNTGKTYIPVESKPKYIKVSRFLIPVSNISYISQDSDSYCIYLKYSNTIIDNYYNRTIKYLTITKSEFNQLEELLGKENIKVL